MLTERFEAKKFCNIKHSLLRGHSFMVEGCTHVALSRWLIYRDPEYYTCSAFLKQHVAKSVTLFGAASFLNFFLMLKGGKFKTVSPLNKTSRFSIQVTFEHHSSIVRKQLQCWRSPTCHVFPTIGTSWSSLNTSSWKKHRNDEEFITS